MEECLIEQVKSLQSKFAENCDEKEVTSFVAQLMRGKEVSVPNGSRGNIGSEIIKLFCEAQKVSNYIFIDFFLIYATFTKLISFLHMLSKIIQKTQKHKNKADL